ncbi:MAG: penicillin-binding protein 2, partial [candidate division Zixibacteria bacterium]|nr:penicillin-binding protein 2 [candidate division Zixibacteria bacterium]
LQLASFFCGLATDGTIYRPHILKEITATDGRIITTQSEVLRSLPFSSSTLGLLKEAMIGVVNHQHGTGVLAQIPDVTVGGKTGTVQNPHGEDHACFVGYAPAENPKIVVAVLVENIGHGGTFAAPVAKRIISKYLKTGVVAEEEDSILVGGNH